MIGKLYLALGVETKTLERGLKRAEKEIAAYGQRMQRIGNTLTMGVTMPIIGIGAAAIRAAGEIESLDKALSTTMRDAGYTTEQAKEELDALRKIAEAPGLDFQQAVKGSLRLQSVGFSAEQARKTLAEFANGVAAAGGSAEQLDSVTVQLAQITSKGKVMNEDLMILKENMPNISKAMVDAFGTADADGIRKLGISSEQFVIKLTEQLSGLGRVEGGISNSITNAGVSLKLFLASIGEELNKTLNIKSMVDSFSAMLGSVAERFKNMDADTKTLIVRLALLAAAAGPVIKVIGFMGTTFGGVITSMTRFFHVIKLIAGGQGLVALKTAWLSLDKAMRLTVIGATIGAVIALGAAIYTLSQQTSVAARVQQKLNEAQVEAHSSTIQEERGIRELVNVLDSETATRKEKQQALKQLKELYPDIWKGYSIENASIEQNSILLAKNIKLIRLQSEARVLGALMDEQTRRRLAAEQNMSQESAVKWYQWVGNIAQGIFMGSDSAIKALENIEKTNKQGVIDDATAQFTGLETRLKSVNEELKVLTGTNPILADRTKDLGDKAGDAKDKFTDLQKATSKLKQELATNEEATKLYGDSVETASDKVKILESGIDNMLKAGGKASDPDILGFKTQRDEAQLLVDALKMLEESRKKFSGPEPMMSTPEDQPTKRYSWGDVDNSHIIKAQENAKKLGEIMTGLSAGTTSVTSAFQQLGITGNNTFELMSAIMTGTFNEVNPLIDKMTEGMSALGQGVSVTAMNIGASLYQMAASGESSFAKLGHAALMMAADAVRATIMTAVTGFVKNILAGPLGKLGPIALGIASAAGAGAGALFNKLVGAVKAPKLAKGGLAFGPTMAVVGDNVGARSNPEVIAPLDKLQSMLGGSMGGDGFIASTRLDGRDLLIVLERAQKDKFRIT